MKIISLSFASAALFAVAVSCSKSSKETEPVVEPEDQQVRVTSVLLSKQHIDLNAGETYELIATVIPPNADNKVVLWNSNKTAVATVNSSGIVKGIGEGNAVITVTTQMGGKTATCTVSVTGYISNPEEPQTREWPDTGAEVSEYPIYNKVSTLSEFPRIDITTDDGLPITSKETYKSGKISFSDPSKMYSDVTSIPEMTMKIRGRGNTTWNAEGGIKNPYRLKLSEKKKVFGMKSDKDWILLADVQDPTLLRNAVALRISRLVSMPWTPDYRAVEVYLNGSYAGCYLLVEAKETSLKNKVPVEPVTGTETNGGYYLEIDDKPDSDLYFITSTFGKQIKYKDPEEPTQAQRAFIEGYINNVEKKLKEKQFTSESGYRSVMEVSTFINNYIVQELTMNVDGNMRLSAYFAKDRDTRLFMPMVWDFDLSLGNCTYLGKDFDLPYYDGSRDGPKGWFIKIRGGYPEDNKGKKDTYYQYLFQDSVFVEELKARWNQVKSRLDMIPGFINKMCEYNAPAYDHNAQGGKNPRATRSYTAAPDAFTSWTEAKNWLVNWYSTRLEWLDSAINSL